MNCWVDIMVPGRQVERVRIAEPSATLGSSSAADIRVANVAGLLAVHCKLRPTPEGCAVEVSDPAANPFTYEGALSRASLVSWGQDVFLGPVRLTLHREEEAAKRSPIVWVAGLVIPLLLAMAFFAPEDEAPKAMIDDEPPALFGDLPACSESKAGSLGRGGVAEQIAIAKHERGVFELADDVESIHLMREAAVCYALGDNQGASDRALDRAEAWVADIQFVYKRALLDLETGRRSAAHAQVIEAAKRLEILLMRAAPTAERFKHKLERDRSFAVTALEEARKAAEQKK